MPNRTRPDAALASQHAVRWADVRRFGKILEETLPSGKVRVRIDFGVLNGRRYILGNLPTRTGGRIRFRDREDAEKTLSSIRGDMVARDLSKEQVLALWFDRGPATEDLIEVRALRYLGHFRELVAEGQRSPTTLREIERYAGDHWSWWEGRPIQAIGYADVDDWHRWLAARVIESGRHKGKPLGAKTRKNASDSFRAMLGWWRNRDPSVAVPRFPSIRVRRYVPTIISMDDQAKVLEAIPWDRRGAFLAAAFEVLRLGEIRAADLADYRDGRLRVTKAIQGPRLDAPVADHTKNDAGEVRDLWNPELIAWIEWRLGQATAERRLAGEVALFWNPTARNRAKRWTPNPMEEQWHRACEKVGVRVPLQEGTRHATLTQLGGALSETVLQAFSRHKDSRSLRKYSKPRPKKKAIVRAIRGEE